MRCNVLTVPTAKFGFCSTAKCVLLQSSKCQPLVHLKIAHKELLDILIRSYKFDNFNNSNNFNIKSEMF